MSGLDELLQDFLAECREGLNQMDGDLVRLESVPDDRTVLDQVFRTLHTIKGNCGFLDFQRLGDLAHAGESLLDRLRQGRVESSQQVCDALLQLVDAIRSSLEFITTHSRESDEDHDELKEQLRSMASTSRQAMPPQDSPQDSPQASAGTAGEAPADFDGTLLHESGNWSSPPDVTQHLDEVRPDTPVEGLALSDLPIEEFAVPAPESPAPKSSATPDVPDRSSSPKAPGVAAIPESKSAGDRHTPAAASVAGTPVGGTPAAAPVAPAASKPAAAKPAATPAAVPSAVAPAKSSGSGSQLSQVSGLSSSNIRVDVDLLDDLMNLVGELVLIRNQILQRTTKSADPGFLAHAQQLNNITSELQERFIKTRMQRIGSIWQRFPRVVRDVARKCGKRVRLEMEGDETELDRTLLEAIADPLTHIVRNAIDHGIEAPAERRADGKPELGLVTLRAYHEGGQVIVEVSDDGSGLDPETIRRKAVEKNLIDEDESILLSHAELLQSVFQAGFSTAESISDVSGRGVGMDVVKTNIERIGGTVNLESKQGVGTTVRMKVPLTLAIIPALIVNSRGHRFAIPQVNVLELFSVDSGNSHTKIERVHSALVCRLRGNLIPLIELHDLLKLSNTEPDLKSEEHRARNRGGRGVDVVVLQVHDRQLGVIVDEVQNNEEIVVKPLSRMIQDVPAFAGTTILGDGRVSLILDGAGIARMTNVFAAQPKTIRRPRESDAAEGQFDFAVGLLVCSVASAKHGETKRVETDNAHNREASQKNERWIAVPLSDVRHIRQFPVTELSETGDELAVQYEGRILPLCDVATAFFGMPSQIPKDGLLRVVIYDQDDWQIGLIVDRVLDIAAAPKDVRPSHQRNILCSAIIDGQITDILNMETIADLHRHETTTSDR